MPARVYITEAAVLGPASFQIFRLLSQRVSVWLAGPLVFALTLLMGELLLTLVWRERAALFLEDALYDTFMFTLLGILAAITYQAAQLYFEFAPNLGLIAVLVFFLFLHQGPGEKRPLFRTGRYRRH
ncbi:MAG: hypothetical protein PWQ13_773 [Bacillota bacterium]|jgi:hypothetical protein|nr:hypothetical protein [Bacillota bacterium]